MFQKAKFLFQHKIQLVTTMASIMTKEEPLLKQIVKSRALKTHRDASASPIRRSTTSKGGNGHVAFATGRSMSQPPLRAAHPLPVNPTVYTLQLLPYSLVYPQVNSPAGNSGVPRPRISFCSTSQPDLSKLGTTSNPLNISVGHQQMGNCYFDIFGH